MIGFAGPRVIEQTIREKLPEGFQRAETVRERAKAHGEWDERFKDDAGLKELERMRSNELPDGWDDGMELAVSARRFVLEHLAAATA